FISSVASGATNVSIGNSYAGQAISSAINAGKDYAINCAVRKEDIDTDSLSDEIYKGLGQGMTREAVYKMMDAYILKYIPEEDKRFDLKAIQALKEKFFAIISAGKEQAVDDFTEEFGKLPLKKRKAIVQKLQAEGDKIANSSAKIVFGKNFKDLSPKELNNPKFLAELEKRTSEFEAQAANN